MKTRLVPILIAAIILCLFSFPTMSKVEANTWYVNPPEGGDGQGSDATGDGSLGNPWLTIQHAIDNASVQNGHTIIVMNGTAQEQITVNKQLTINSQNGANNTTVQTPTSSNSAFIVTANYVTITGFTTVGPGNYGILLNSVESCNILNNTCTNSSYGISLNSSNNNTISNNICNSNSSFGIDCVGSSSNNTISNNTCNSNSSGLRSNSSNINNISNNTVNSNDYDGIQLSSQDNRSEEHTSELQSHSFISYAVFCLKKKN